MNVDPGSALAQAFHVPSWRLRRRSSCDEKGVSRRCSGAQATTLRQQREDGSKYCLLYLLIGTDRSAELTADNLSVAL